MNFKERRDLQQYAVRPRLLEGGAYKNWTDWANSRTVNELKATVTSLLHSYKHSDFAYWMRKFGLEIRCKDGNK